MPHLSFGVHRLAVERLADAAAAAPVADAARPPEVAMEAAMA